jgi:predicted  nucleic acid-binding Zn-ribbon protein|tara:strand:- start:19813 stop:20013 length:201 start_codon:yes stop_codon:yes gene_type:complete
MNKEIKELKEEIKALKQRISGLERDLDYQVNQSNSNSGFQEKIRELQEAVASMANQPVGMMFDYRA